MNDIRSDMYAVCVRGTPALCTALEELLSEYTPSPVVWMDNESSDCCVYFYAEDAAELPTIETHIIEICRTYEDICAHGTPEIMRLCLPYEEWAESWKKHFRPTRVGAHFLIMPSWEIAAVPEDVCVITIDPGMAFGTGLHGTTRGCLELMEPYFCAAKPVQTLCDIGCGSGILSIAAALCGCAAVYACDNEETAVRVTRENSVVNGVDCKIETHVCDIVHTPLPATYPFVCANILADVLESACAHISQAVEVGGYLLLSGMLPEQYAGVYTCYHSRGFVEEKRVERDGWVSAVLRLRRDGRWGTEEKS